MFVLVDFPSKIEYRNRKYLVHAPERKKYYWLTLQ